MKKARAPLFFLILLSLLLYSIHGEPEAARSSFAELRGGENDDKLRNMYGSAAAEEEISWEKMGLESCGEAEEECMKRRMMMMDAHLDYIYTQNMKP